MIINHHNYEEYFILYMDNELSSDDRRMVEVFIEQHPHLAGELNLLQQYKLAPDTSVVYKGKEELLKTDSAAVISMANYEEWLLLYVDNELTPEQKASVDRFLGANLTVQKEFALLQHTQLQPENILFADKASLYRTEEKVKPMPVRWWRIAAAAILLLGIGITVAIVVTKKTPAGGEIVKSISPEKKTSTETPVVIPKETSNKIDQTNIADNTPDNQAPVPEVKKAVINNTTAKQYLVIQKNKQPVVILPLPIKEEPVIVTNNKPSNNLPTPLENPSSIKKDAVANNNIPKEIMNPKNSLTNPAVTTQNSQPSDIVNAAYKNTDAAMLDQPAEKKNKNRGIFRKIARTFEKRTDIDPTDDNKLLIAGLSIKLK